MTHNLHAPVFAFEKEAILPSTDLKSPFYINLPSADAKPIDNLLSFFKYWKYFVKSLIHYFQDIALVKQFEANLSLQLVSSVQFPGFKDLPVKIARDLSNLQSLTLPVSLSHNDQQLLLNSTSPKERPNLLPTPSSNSVISSSSASSIQDQKENVKNASYGNTSQSADAHLAAKRPNLFKTKSSGNTSFLKTASNSMGMSSLHKRNASSSGGGIAGGGVGGGIGGSSAGGSNGGGPQTQNGTSPLINSSAQFTADVKIPPNFFPQDSLFNSCAPILLNNHQHTYQLNQKIHRDLTQKLVPRLHGLLRNLLSKIKEIKSSLKNESFSQIDIAKEVSQTGQILYQYMSAVESYSSPLPVLKRRLANIEAGDEDNAICDDPFLLKLQVDYQVKRQLLHESYMFASWVNLQSISKELLAYILKELHVVLDKFGKLQFSSEMHNILKTAIANSSAKDWEHFILNNPNFLNTFTATSLNSKREVRHLVSITLPYSSSIHNKCLRLGVLYKKSKLLKNYTRYFYLLTCNYLHEFRIEVDDDQQQQQQQQHKNGTGAASKAKNPTVPAKKFSKDKIGGFIGHDDAPIRSYNLNDLLVKVKDDNAFKFEIGRKSSGSKKATFKCYNQADWLGWYTDLEQLCSFGNKHYERFAFVHNRIKLKEQDSAPAVKSGATSAPPSSATSSTPAAAASARIASAGLLSSAGSTLLPKNLSKQLHLLSNTSLSSMLSVKDAHPADTPLSGMFTPTIRTPREEGANPFESTFLSGWDGNESTRSQSPTPGNSPSVSSTGAQQKPPPPVPQQPASSGMTTPAALGGTPLSATSHQQEHESYLKMQREILRRQQHDYFRLQDVPVNKNANEINPLLLLPASLQRKSSSESMQSFEVSSSGINTALAMSQGMMAMEINLPVSPESKAARPARKVSDTAPDVYVSSH